MDLEDITYSREEAIAAIKNYYAFLTEMYMDESHVVHPPPGGWPSIVNADPALLESFGKSDEVLALLAHLPYIRHPKGVSEDAAEPTPGCIFANWAELFKPHPSWADSDSAESLRKEGKTLRIITEGTFPRSSDSCPHVIGLTHGGDQSGPILVLDTELGIIHWENCYERIEESSEYRETMVDYDWHGEAAEGDDEALEEEADWRADAPAWAFSEFFEVLKDQYRKLHWVPISEYTVRSTHEELHNEEDMMSMVKDIYRQHGWPDLAVYRRSECLEAVKKAMAERYPESTCYRLG